MRASFRSTKILLFLSLGAFHFHLGICACVCVCVCVRLDIHIGFEAEREREMYVRERKKKTNNKIFHKQKFHWINKKKNEKTVLMFIICGVCINMYHFERGTGLICTKMRIVGGSMNGRRGCFFGLYMCFCTDCIFFDVPAALFITFDKLVKKMKTENFVVFSCSFVVNRADWVSGFGEIFWLQ
jgi:hypothetical protein